MYDEEGKEFGLVEIGDSLYWINGYRQLSKIDPVKYHLPSYAKPYQIIMELAKEVIEDVKKYLDAYSPDRYFVTQEQFDQAGGWEADMRLRTCVLAWMRKGV